MMSGEVSIISSKRSKDATPCVNCSVKLISLSIGGRTTETYRINVVRSATPIFPVAMR